MAELSKTQIDRIGDRLRQGNVTDDDLRRLDEYRGSFSAAYEHVVHVIGSLGLEPTGRPEKTTDSIADKLVRESIRLTQVQDIAGCRLTVADIAEQDRVVAELCAVLPGSRMMDRRETPSYGYRAVHVIAQVEGRYVEIQIRTSLQHLWAQLSERLSDRIDPTIKYGGGHLEVREMLQALSGAVAVSEALARDLLIERVSSPGEDVSEFEALLRRNQERLANVMRNLLTELETEREAR